ncbi:MAG: D-aminoacyl-tRNA deacylase [Puniceicoccaceae bacterium]
MRVVVQRVKQAKVIADGKLSGAIGPGLLVFLGIEQRDTQEDATWLAEKIPVIRCFEDEQGKMNRSLQDKNYEIMVISQFTLYGSLRKGTRPSFNRAALPDSAIPLYEFFVTKLEQLCDKPVATGVFGAYMEIDAANDGPVTLIIDTKDKDL